MSDIGSPVPDFTASSQKGVINFYDFVSGSWCVFLSHPADFTPVCTTEFGMISKLQKEFSARNCKVLGLSIDSVESHEMWIRDINETQDTVVDFPVIADVDGSVSAKFGMSELISKEGEDPRYEIVNRTLLVVDPLRNLQLRLVYPSNVGRNFYEVIRIIDALQLTMFHPVGTPANWKAGEDVLILPEVSDEEARKRFPKGFKEIKPYLRITAYPDSDSDNEEEEKH